MSPTWDFYGMKAFFRVKEVMNSMPIKPSLLIQTLYQLHLLKRSNNKVISHTYLIWK